MATIRRRPGRKGVYVYYYDTKENRLRQVPRSVTCHWDDLSDEEIEKRKREWEEDHGIARDRIQRHSLSKEDKLKKLWDEYQLNRRRFKKRGNKTQAQETRHFEGYICPFFVRENQAKDPTKWHDLVPKFHNWLFEQDISDSYRRAILWALERFGEYLVFQRIMPFPFAIQTPTAENLKVTPLKVRIGPEDVLRAVRAHNFRREHRKHASRTRICRINFRLAVLISYFASIGPEELWALEKEDFVTGHLATVKSKTYASFHALTLDGKQATKDDGPEKRLGSMLAVKIEKGLDGGIVKPYPKNEYRFGWVTIWHPEAAKMIASMLKDAPSGRLFPFTRGHVDKEWREIAKPIIGATVHDLRRASCLYLGRTLRLPGSLLQEHMRHAEFDTTLLYMRDPLIEEKTDKEVVEQDFDDVV